MSQPTAIFPTIPPTWAAIDLRRIRSAVCLLGSWLLVGAIIGLVQREQVGSDLTHAVASVIAGMIVVPLFGSFTLFFGATWQDTIIGTALGSVAALIFASDSPGGTLSLGAAHYILIGALLATTVRPLAVECRRLLYEPKAIRNYTPKALFKTNSL